MDTLRMYAHAHLEMLPEQGDPDEPQIEDQYNTSELWDTIRNLLTNERERRVAYLCFHCNLKPREIMRHCPGDFVNEREIYQIKRNIIERITRNIDKIRWRLGG
jgi:DNA-directed RNA polymerase specialized sigma subunit